jgi:hypothetical protein
VANLTVLVRPGDRVRPYSQASYKLGYAVLAGPDRPAVDRAADQLAALLRFTVVPTGGTR